MATYLNAPQVAELLGLHLESVRKMARDGRLPAFKAGRGWRFDRADLEAWKQRQQRGGPPDARQVLVVDDEAQVRDVIGRLAGRLGYRVRQASDGEAGLARVREARPDLILLDLVMPGMNGPQFLARLRADHPTLPVVIVTSYPDSELMVEASRHAPLLLLAKPIDLGALERTLRSVLGGEMVANAGGG